MDGPRLAVTLAALGLIAWLGVVVIGYRLAQAGPPGVGFDLQLLIDAGRKAAAGHSLYSAQLLAGATVEAESLFYSYPPFVAQVIALVAWLPSSVILVGWAIGATLAVALVNVPIVHRFRQGVPATAIVFATVAVGPLVMPYAIGMLFGNLNVFFPALYGLVLLAALAGPDERRTRVAGGLALGIAAATKIHPVLLALWFVVRGIRQRRDGQRPVAWEVVAVAGGTGLVLLVGSLIVGGVGPWQDYLAVARASSGADLLDHRNYGPAAQVAMTVGLDEAAVRLLHLLVLVVALIVTLATAWLEEDPLESLAWAAVASLVTLPVTWIHYPAALIPFAVAALARRPGVAPWVVAAMACVVLAISYGLFLWLAIALTLGAVRAAGRATFRGTTAPAPA
jgi:hypothetical protein